MGHNEKYKKKSKSSRQKSQMFSFGQFCQMKTLFHENLQHTDKLWQLWLYIWLVVTVRFRIWSQHFSWRVRPVLERHSAANKEETPQQRQETRWVIACSPWAYSLWITLSNADFSFLFFLGVGNVIWQNPGAGAAQNFKNSLGHNSLVSSWVMLIFFLIKIRFSFLHM